MSRIVEYKVIYHGRAKDVSEEVNHVRRNEIRERLCSGNRSARIFLKRSRPIVCELASEEHYGGSDNAL